MLRRTAVVLALLVASGIARADGQDDFVEAQRLKDELQWEAALEAVDRAFAAGSAGRGRVIELYVLAGTLQAGLGRDGEAFEAFGRALAIEPDLVLPEGTSPTITAPFERARASSTPLLVHAELEQSGDLGRISVVVDADRFQLIRRARIDRRVGELTQIAPVGEVGIPVEALDAHGNVVWSDTVWPPPHQVVIDYARPPVYARFELWGGFALMSAIAAGVSAWQLDTAQDEWNALRDDDGAHDFSELTAVEARGRRHAFTANLTLALAGVTAVVSTALALRERRIDRGRPHVAVTADGGLGLAIAGGF